MAHRGFFVHTVPDLATQAMQKNLESIQIKSTSHCPTGQEWMTIHAYNQEEGPRWQLSDTGLTSKTVFPTGTSRGLSGIMHCLVSDPKKQRTTISKTNIVASNRESGTQNPHRDITLSLESVPNVLRLRSLLQKGDERSMNLWDQTIGQAPRVILSPPTAGYRVRVWESSMVGFAEGNGYLDVPIEIGQALELFGTTIHAGLAPLGDHTQLAMHWAITPHRSTYNRFDFQPIHAWPTNLPLYPQTEGAKGLATAFQMGHRKNEKGETNLGCLTLWPPPCPPKGALLKHHNGPWRRLHLHPPWHHRTPPVPPPPDL